MKIHLLDLTIYLKKHVATCSFLYRESNKSVFVFLYQQI